MFTDRNIFVDAPKQFWEDTSIDNVTQGNEMNATYKILGISDKTECDCCGKKNLKSSVALENQQSGEIVYFGVDCASKAMRQRYMGKRYKISREAVKSMAIRAKKELVILESA